MPRGSRSRGPVLLCALVAVATSLLGLGRLSWTPEVRIAKPAVVVPTRSVPEQGAEFPRIRDVSDLPQPRVRAEAAMLYHPVRDEILWESNGLEPRPIASITKVMTAVVFLEQEPDLTRDVVISRRDVRRASTTYLRRRERISLRDLMHLALVASDNAAARTLARVSPWGTAGFVERMNRRAAELGLASTTFVDPAGLSEQNLSSAYDLSRLIVYASEYPPVARILRTTSYRARTSRRWLTVRNTNRLLRGRFVIYGGKTGYIDESGYCLATVVKLPGSDPLAVVVLGARSNSGRFREARRLINWVSTQGRSLIIPGAHRAD